MNRVSLLTDQPIPTSRAGWVETPGRGRSDRKRGCENVRGKHAPHSSYHPAGKRRETFLIMKTFFFAVLLGILLGWLLF